MPPAPLGWYLYWKFVIINIMQQTLKIPVPVGAELGPVQPQLVLTLFSFLLTLYFFKYFIPIFNILVNFIVTRVIPLHQV